MQNSLGSLRALPQLLCPRVTDCRLDRARQLCCFQSHWPAHTTFLWCIEKLTQRPFASFSVVRCCSCSCWRTCGYCTKATAAETAGRARQQQACHTSQQTQTPQQHQPSTSPQQQSSLRQHQQHCPCSRCSTVGRCRCGRKPGGICQHSGTGEAWCWIPQSVCD